jgi:hypothetical protein
MLHVQSITSNSFFILIYLHGLDHKWSVLSLEEDADASVLTVGVLVLITKLVFLQVSDEILLICNFSVYAFRLETGRHPGT